MALDDPVVATTTASMGRRAALALDKSAEGQIVDAAFE
jgi:hypothetical protein